MAPTGDPRVPPQGGVLKVGDLIEVATVRPVVRLADLSDPGLREDLAQAFVLTEDARHVLATVMGDMRTGRGRGYVLEGHYGAGKSHLVAVLHGLASGAFSDEEIGAAVPEGGGAGPRRWQSPGAALRPLPVAVSLLEHAAREPLEGIVLRGLAGALGDPSFRPEGAGSRVDVWESVRAHAATCGYDGLLLCLDEVGEFLQAKPDARAFAEDVRFLQYLGEWAGRGPAWVVLCVQESLEQAGDMPAAVSGGLRDRYAVRFRLGAGHIADLVCHRLIRRRPGSEVEIARLCQEFVRTFGAVPGGLEAVTQVYPVHPLTIDLLDRLRPLFSQRRGVIDFVASRLAGDAARRIPTWLDRPADRLLGPDRLVDHFRDRIRERPDTAPLVDRALDYFERDMPRLFSDPELAALSRRLGKILIAGALCPTPLSFSVEQLTLALAHRFSRLDPALNREFVGDLVERLATGGAYVGRSDEPAAGGLGTERRYRCDLRADLHPVLRSRMAAQRRTLSLADGRLWRALLSACADPAVPWAFMGEHRATTWDIVWRRTTRRVLCRLAPPDAVTPAAVAEWARDVQDSPEADALVVVLWGPPTTPGEAGSQWQALGDPQAGGLHPDLPLLVWTPRLPGPDEARTLVDLAAHLLVDAEVESDFSEVGRRLHDHLESGRAEVNRRVSGLIRELYLQGRVVDADGASRRPADLGPAPLTTLLARLLDEALARRYPEHPSLTASAARVSEPAVVSAVTRLLRGGDPGAPGSPEEQAVAGLLAPLGLCRRDARGWRLAAADEAGPHAAALLAALEGSDRDHAVSVAVVYARLRKGPGGLGRREFEVLCFTLARAGEVSLRRRGRRLGPDQITFERVWDAEGLFRGALLARELRTVLRELPMLPAELRARALSHGSQRAAWQAVCAWRREWEQALPEVREQVARALRTPCAASLVGPDRLRALEDLVGLLPCVAVSLPPEEGLARFCRALIDHPGGPRVVEKAQELRRLLAERLDALTSMAAYLDAPEFGPGTPDLAEAARSLRARLADPEGPDTDGWTAVTLEFTTLRRAYAQAYQAEHAAAVGPESVRACEAVLASSDMRLARKLDGLRAAEAVGAAAVDELAEEVTRRRCTIEPSALDERLRHVPGCRCGFVSGQHVQAPARRLADRARDAARSALEALRRPEVAARLDQFAAGLAPGPLATLGRLRAVEPADGDGAHQALTWLTELGPLGDLAVEAASGVAATATLELTDLQAAVCTRTWTPGELRSQVDRWLDGAGDCRRLHVRPPTGSARADAGALVAEAWQQARAALRAAASEPPSEPPGWEQLWQGPAGAWQRRYAEAKQAGAATDAEGAEATECAARLETAFRSGAAATAVRDGLAPVGRLLDRLATGGAVPFAFCVDALRCDLMEAFLQELAGHPRLHVRQRGVTWALSPTVTEAQFDTWAREGWPVELARQDGGTALSIARVGRLALARACWTAGRCVCKWDFLDRRLHEADGEFGLLAAEFRVQIRYLLLPALRCLARGDLAVVFGDHGFRSRESPTGWRYTHGGDAPDEVLTPWCLVGCD